LRIILYNIKISKEKDCESNFNIIVSIVK
jgi:hypothetical protein